jgi:AcrR family transcriptional regulator
MAGRREAGGEGEGPPRRRRGRPRKPLRAADILATAIRVADAEGIEAVSIRRIARELDGRPMSIYDHFASKDDLLGAMREEAIGAVPGPLPEGWREALATIARRTYATMVAHPWIVTVSGRARRFGPNATEAARQSAAAAAGLGLGPEELWVVQGTLNDYVLGHSLRIASIPRDTDRGEAVPADLIAAAELADTPELAALPESLRTRDSLARFEAGLEIVLDGIAARHLP